MKVLWITNIVFPEAEQLLKGSGDLKASGGWMLGAATQLVKNEKIELTVASVCRDVKKLTFLKGEKMSFYLLPFGKGNTKINKEYEKYWSLINSVIRPDIVHIHGTEYSHGLAYVRACGSKNVVVSIQGLLSSYLHFYYGGIPVYKLTLNTTIRDIYKRNNILIERNLFRKSSEYEIELLQSVSHIIGRTSWDKAHVWAINPEAQYHFCNETLRDVFYEGHWDFNKCNKHSIFLSQASYPIKGLHQVISALPFVLSKYPDTMVRVAGVDITHSGCFKERIKINNYGKFIKNLIKKLSVGDHVVFTGPLSSEGMKKEYLGANVFVCPSSIENSPNSLGEAQLLGCPVIASYVGGVPDMMRGGEDNMYRFEDTEMLAWKICSIFDMGNNVDTSTLFKEAIQRHDPLTNMHTLLDIYSSIIII